MRGVNIGYIKYIQLQVNSVIVLLYIQSPKILIPKNCIIETNQVGLFNNTTIDIIPLDYISAWNDINVFSIQCSKSFILCHHDYIRGYRGLNYDDLIRAATRISQRFDDPRFFQLFYILLSNIIDLSYDIKIIVNYTSYIVDFLLDLIDLSLIKYIL